MSAARPAGGRRRLGMADEAVRTAGYRHGRRDRQLLGSFGPVTISVPRARLDNACGTSRERHSKALPRYARMTKQVEAVIAGAYLSGTNTRRVRRALGALFKGAVSKGTVSRTARHLSRHLLTNDLRRVSISFGVPGAALSPAGRLAH